MVLERLFGKKKAEKLDGQVRADAEEVLRICKNCNHYASISYDEMKFHFFRHRGTVDEKRLKTALDTLKRLGMVSWSGNDISFSKSQIPTRLYGV